MFDGHAAFPIEWHCLDAPMDPSNPLMPIKHPLQNFRLDPCGRQDRIRNESSRPHQMIFQT